MNRFDKKGPTDPGFTRIELLMATAIIAISAAIFVSFAKAKAYI
jgi:prepilin-type N-terminal cleavage/methylation domain-containing protein